MSNDQPGEAPPTRDPVSHGRAATEGGVLTMLGVVVAWGVTLLPIEIPIAVQTAIVGLVVALGTLALSERRNRRHDLDTLGKGAVSGIALGGLVLVFVVGCVSWDGPGYRRLANDEVARLIATPPTTALNPASCEALSAGAKALRNEEGDSTSLKAPFFTGQHVGSVGDIQERNALRCFELAKRDAERGVDAELRGRVRAAWVKTWRNGRALHGGGE